MVAPVPVASLTAGHVVVERVTKDNRHLFYRLEVIQQPERARACGSGPKCASRLRPPALALGTC